jgi:hypothetical protein
MRSSHARVPLPNDLWCKQTVLCQEAISDKIRFCRKKVIAENTYFNVGPCNANTLGDFKVGVSVGVYCTKCTLNTGVNTNFEITHCRAATVSTN